VATSLLNPAYNKAVLDAVAAQSMTVAWAEVTAQAGGHSATFKVFADALKLPVAPIAAALGAQVPAGSPEQVRISVSATLEQQIADLLGCLLLTPRLSDMVYLQAGKRIEPQPMPIAATLEAMCSVSARVDKAAGGASFIAPAGKDWCIDNDLLAHPGRAENYGWQTPGASWAGSSWEPAVTPGLRVVQGRGWAHDASHLDYSQVCRLVHRRCTVDGATRDLAEVLSDPQLAPLASHQGALKVLRQPGVAPYACPIPVGSVAGAPSELCPMPPAPSYGTSVGGIAWGRVAFTAGALAATVGLFALAVRYAGRAARR
jgi:hypothetical protein